MVGDSSRAAARRCSTPGAAADEAPTPRGSSKAKPGVPEVVVSVTLKELREFNRQKLIKRQAEKLRLAKQAIAAVQAGQLHQLEWLARLPDAPVYSPTAEQWGDPLVYIRSIQAEAAAYGICTIRAPVPPSTPGAAVLGLGENGFSFTTRTQDLHEPAPQRWGECTFSEGGRRYTLRQFQEHADTFAARRFGGVHCSPPARTVEAEYWREREAGAAPSACGAPARTALSVEYGNDLDGSAFLAGDPLGDTQWNLGVLPVQPQSCLRHCTGPMAGVSTPMLYVGQLFATFAWHVEDHWLYSINYQHQGAHKTWYGVPGAAAEAFEAAAARVAYAAPCAAEVAAGSTPKRVALRVAAELAGKTTMFSPRHLMDAGVPVYRAEQAPGCFVLTFPRSYHAGFSAGFCLGEAVNFAMGEWWPFGEAARRQYLAMQRTHILPHDQALTLEGIELAGELRRRAASAGTPPRLAPGEWELADAFVRAVRAAAGARAALEERGVSVVAAPPAKESVRCVRCEQLSYCCSVAPGHPGGEAPPPEEQLCLECAAADEAVGAGSVMFVKPAWRESLAALPVLEAVLAQGPSESSLPPEGLPACSTPGVVEARRAERPRVKEEAGQEGRGQEQEEGQAFVRIARARSAAASPAPAARPPSKRQRSTPAAIRAVAEERAAAAEPSTVGGAQDYGTPPALPCDVQRQRSMRHRKRGGGVSWWIGGRSGGHGSGGNGSGRSAGDVPAAKRSRVEQPAEPEAERPCEPAIEPAAEQPAGSEPEPAAKEEQPAEPEPEAEQPAGPEPEAGQQPPPPEQQQQAPLPAPKGGHGKKQGKPKPKKAPPVTHPLLSRQAINSKHPGKYLQPLRPWDPASAPQGGAAPIYIHDGSALVPLRSIQEGLLVEEEERELLHSTGDDSCAAGALAQVLDRLEAALDRGSRGGLPAEERAACKVVWAYAATRAGGKPERQLLVTHAALRTLLRATPDGHAKAALLSLEARLEAVVQPAALPTPTRAAAAAAKKVRAAMAAAAAEAETMATALALSSRMPLAGPAGAEPELEIDPGLMEGINGGWASFLLEGGGEVGAAGAGPPAAAQQQAQLQAQHQQRAALQAQQLAQEYALQLRGRLLHHLAGGAVVNAPGEPLPQVPGAGEPGAPGGEARLPRYLLPDGRVVFSAHDVFQAATGARAQTMDALVAALSRCYADTYVMLGWPEDLEPPQTAHLAGRPPGSAPDIVLGQATFRRLRPLFLAPGSGLMHSALPRQDLDPPAAPGLPAAASAPEPVPQAGAALRPAAPAGAAAPVLPHPQPGWQPPAPSHIAQLLQAAAAAAAAAAVPLPSLPPAPPLASLAPTPAGGGPPGAPGRGGPRVVYVDPLAGPSEPRRGS